ncbi:unnamed protein product [Paramecium sonneborni]|uniref:non-specific serine/threonine protein kinase n=1 Tax=Paramecium sonneborni TaxID=65129 RepID=A0A8S1NLC7_9CILI|nr:unnamed protein product [Paramecium sonneborni]
MQYSQYNRVKALGEGAYGKAYLVKDVNDGSFWVQKQIDINLMTEKEKIETYREFKVLQQLQHPNIIKFRDVYLTTSGKLCIIMEYADRGDLGQIIKSQNGKQLPENQILDWFTQICLALKHVHDRKILHRDLKCQNIFLTKNNRIKLGDFGIARVLSHTLENAKTQIGTPYYLSPEMIESKPYSYSSDIWSLGIVLYEMCMLKPPFEADSLHFLCLKICKGTFSNISSNYSADLNNIVKQLLQTTSNRRPTINKILKIPLIVNRIKEFLTQSIQKNEFSHTILHKQKLNIDNNVTELKILDDLPKPPILNSQQQSGPIYQNPAPLIKATNSTPNNIQNNPKPSQPKQQQQQQQQPQKQQPQKRERSFTPQKNQIKKQNNIQVSKNNPIINIARNDSKKKVDQVQSNNQIPQTKRDSQVEQNSKKSKLINNVSSPSLQQKQPLQKPQIQQQPSQQQLKQQQQPQQQIESFENLNEYDDTEQDEPQMDFGIKFEQSDEKNAIEDAKICAKMEEALIEKDEIDEQFEQKKKQIMETEGQSDIRVEEDEVESSLETSQPVSDSSKLSFFGKTNGVLQLKTLLEQALGANKTQQAIKILLNELNTKPLEDVEKHGQNYYQKLLPFLSLEERKNFVPLLFQLIVLTK